MPDDQLSPQDFAAKIRAKYPGSYDGIPDMVLAHKVLAKYPEYTSSVKMPATGATPTGNIASVKTSFLDRLESDVRTGSATTIPGQILAKLGARGTDTGVSEGVANQGPASMVLGPIKAAQGIQDLTQGKILQGGGKVLSGTAQAMTIPGAFLGNAPGAAESVMGRTIPSVMKEQAGQKFQQVMTAAGNATVDVNPAGNAALNIQQLASRGSSMPKVIRDFLRRVTDPEGGPLTYQEARDFYSNATSLSANEAGRLNAKQTRALGEFVRSLGQSVKEAASGAGQGEKYASAMQQYRTGAQAGKGIDNFVKYGLGLATGIGVVDYMLKNYLLGGKR